MGRFFKICPNLSQIEENFRKIGWFWSKIGPKLNQLVYEWVTFSWKIEICMGLLSNSVVTHPYQNVPPWVFWRWQPENIAFIPLYSLTSAYIHAYQVPTILPCNITYIHLFMSKPYSFWFSICDVLIFWSANQTTWIKSIFHDNDLRWLTWF